MKASSWLSRLIRHVHVARVGRCRPRHKSRSVLGSLAEALENRTLLTAPQFTSMTDWSLPENDTGAALAEATDADNDPLTYAIAGTGADDAFFTIDPTTGDLTFLVAPDFEHPADANFDNLYEVDVEVDDQNSGPVSQTIRVTVTDIDDEAPVITSDAFVIRDEGETFVQIILATDADAQSILQYSLTGNGADDALFTIDPALSLVSFVNAPSFANPIDANQDNIYEFEVQVTDGFQTTTQLVQVSINPVTMDPVVAFNEGPVTFKKGKFPAEIASKFTLTGANFGGGTVEVSINNVNTGKKRADILAAASVSLLGTSDTVLQNGRYVTKVLLDANVTADDIQHAIRDLAFFTSKKGLNIKTRNIKIRVTDNTGHSAESSQTINVKKK